VYPLFMFHGARAKGSVVLRWALNFPALIVQEPEEFLNVFIWMLDPRPIATRHLDIMTKAKLFRSDYPQELKIVANLNPRPEGPLSIHCGAYFPPPLIKLVGRCDIHRDTRTNAN